MDNFTDPVQEIETEQALLGHRSHDWNWGTLVIVSFDHLKEVHSQDLKNSHKMLSMWPMMQKAIE